METEMVYSCTPDSRSKIKGQVLPKAVFSPITESKLILTTRIFF